MPIQIYIVTLSFACADEGSIEVLFKSMPIKIYIVTLSLACADKGSIEVL